MKIGILGYGNLGKSAEQIILDKEGCELVGIFTRRAPRSIKAKTERVYYVNELEKFKGEIDVMLLCIGSKNDSMTLAPEIAKQFNTVDCFDTHSRAGEYLSLMDKSAKSTNHVSVCMAGWDPGVFSLVRILLAALSGEDNVHTFWGRGVSQGHSEAIRGISGVEHAVSYTVPDEKARMLARLGVPYDTGKSHKRECFVVAENDRERIEEEILTMPDYFLNTPTRVTFLDEKIFKTAHKTLSHNGEIISLCKSGCNSENESLVSFKLNLDSNPDFTATVMLAYAMALPNLLSRGVIGALTPCEIPVSYLFDGYSSLL